MALLDLFNDQLTLIQGVEKDLRTRRRRASTGGLVALGGVFLQLVLALFNPDHTDNLRSIGGAINDLVRLDFDGLFEDGLPVPELTAAALLVGGATTYVVMRWTGVLLRQSKEPFRYTVSVDPFMDAATDTGGSDPAQGQPSDSVGSQAAGTRLGLLHHDLVERLSSRIQRLSLLDLSAESETGESDGGAPVDRRSSHIHVEGHFTVRERTKDQWMIQVMPRVRIGGVQQPSTLASVVTYDVGSAKGEINADQYFQIVERVYARVAAEAYRQIESDIRGKQTLFPTSYLRAVALYHEADDFLRSNTIDAYDQAIGLYRESLRYFHTSGLSPVFSLLARLPVLWRPATRFIHQRAQVESGYAKAITYKRILSALTGRQQNPVYEVPDRLDRRLQELEILHDRITKRNSFLTFPADSWRGRLRRRPDERLYSSHRRVHAEVLVIAALAHYLLDSVGRASGFLARARQVEPENAESDALFLTTEAMLTPELDQAIQLLQRASEVEPDFQLSRFELAKRSEMRFISGGDLSVLRARQVIELYNNVNLINPGNIAAIAARAHLLWLIEDLDEARDLYRAGIEFKSIAQETFVGELNYGLARVLAEDGRQADCFSAYLLAIGADPSVAAATESVRPHSNERSPMVQYMCRPVLERFKLYSQRSCEQLEAKRDSGVRSDAEWVDGSSPHVLSVVESFVLNDYGNAALNHNFRYGDYPSVCEAEESYRAALSALPTNAAVHFNLALTLWAKASTSFTPMDGGSGEFDRLAAEVERLAPTWRLASTQLARTRLDYLKERLVEVANRRADAERSLKRVEDQVLEREREEQERGQEGEGLSEPPSTGVRSSVSDGPRSGLDAAVAGSTHTGYARPQATISHSPSRRSTISSPTSGDPSHRHDLDDVALGRRDVEALAELERDLRERIGEEGKRLLGRVIRRGTGVWSLISDPQALVDLRPQVVTLAPARADRLTEADIDAVMLAAEVLAAIDRAETPKGSQDRLVAQTNAGRLTDLLDRLSPERFDLARLRLESHIDDSKRDAAARTIKDAVSWALRADPISFQALTWVAYTSNLEWETGEREGLLDAAIKQAASSPSHTALRAEFVVANFISGQRELAYSLLRGGPLPEGQDPDALVGAVVEELTAAGNEATPSPRHHTSLGRARQLLGQQQAAAESFRRAVELSPDSAELHSSLGSAAEGMADWEGAVASYGRARDLDDSKANQANLLSAYNAGGNDLFGKGRYSESVGWYREALAVGPDPVVYANLARALEQAAAHRAVDDEWFDEAITALQQAEHRAPDVATAGRYGEEIERLTLVRRLSPPLRLGLLGQRSVEDPIVLEVTAEFIPFVSTEDDDLDPDLLEQIDDMRRDLTESCGVEVPGVRVRGRTGGGDSQPAFVIAMDGVAPVWQLLSPTVRFSPANPEVLTSRGVTATPVAHPLSGAPGSWVPEDEWAILKEGHDPVELWPITGFMIKTLHAHVRDHLAAVLSIDAVAKRLDGSGPDLRAEVENTTNGLAGFTSVLRRLLVDGVPIVDLETLATGYVGHAKEERSGSDIAARLRSVIGGPDAEAANGDTDGVEGKWIKERR